MKTFKKVLILFSCVVLLTACPYESSEPLSSDKGVTITSSNELSGRWVYKANEDSLVLQVEESTSGLRIIMTDTEGEQTKFDGTLSSINGIEFINLKNTERSTSKYYFVKYEVKSNKLKAYYAADKYISNYREEGQDLREFFVANSSKKGFWTNKMTFSRQ